MHLLLLTAIQLLVLQNMVEGGSECGCNFTDKFMFGAATAAYQTEGAWDVEGKGPNIWDTYTHIIPHEILDNSNGDIAALSYYKFKEDNRLIRDLGMQHYRFSISWSRIMPTGLANNINKNGIDHYNKLINDMLQNNIIPMVTIYHWDLPQYLQNLGGWTNNIIIQAFKDYAEVLFENFGDRVKYWFTINEPDFVSMGYEGRNAKSPRAPNVDSPGIGYYLAGHNMLLSHAEVFHLYDRKFRPKQNGKISIPLQASWVEPLDINSTEDNVAAERMRHQTMGWFAQPIFGKHGDYPQVMKDRIANNSRKEGFRRSRLPEFTPEQVNYIKGTADFFSLNHYTTHVVTPKEDGWMSPSALKDRGVSENVPSWLPRSPTQPWLSIAPQGIRRQLNFIKENYGDLDVLISENGYGDSGELEDNTRVEYLGTYLSELLKAICEDGIRVIGYTVWSIIDNFQWRGGYSSKFGLYSVNFTDPDRPRTPRKSATFIKDIISSRHVPCEYSTLVQQLDLDRRP